MVVRMFRDRTMKVSVKATHLTEFSGGETVDVRRFEVPYGCTMSELDGKLRAMFPSLRAGEFSLGWLDADGDVVSLSTDEELRVALEESGGARLSLHAWRGERGAAGPAPGSCTPHRGVCCDVCQQTPRGLRYKCLTCDDYDLCHTCCSRGLHREHLMVRIGSPDHNWRPFFRRGNALFNRGRSWCPGGARTSHAEEHSASRDDASDRQRQNPSGLGGPRQSPKYMLNPRCVFNAVHSAMASLGNGFVPENGRTNFGPDWTEGGLREVGQSISNVLESFGIASDVDVERRGAAGTCRPSEQPDTAAETGDSQPCGSSEQGSRTVLEEPCGSSEQGNGTMLEELGVSAVSLMDQHRETRAPVTSAADQPPSPSSDGADSVTDWTVLDGAAAEITQVCPTREPATGDASNSQVSPILEQTSGTTTANSPGGVYPVVAPIPETTTAITATVESTTTSSGRFFHQDANIEYAFEKLIGMGFVVNERVTRIILEEKGNVPAVLERIFHFG